MAYGGLLTLVVLAVVGVFIGKWSQRRGGGEVGVGEVGGEQGEALASGLVEGGTAGGEEIIAVIAAAIAAAAGEGRGDRSRVWVRSRGAISPWATKGRQEAQSSLTFDWRWRLAR